jgi:hypothetical protein
MKNIDLFRLRDGLIDVSNLKGVKFAYSVLKNKKLIEDEISYIQKSIEMSQEYQNYERSRIMLCEKHADKDKDGKSIIISGAYQIENKTEFNMEVEKIKNENLKFIEERMKQVNDYEILLQEENDIVEKLSKVKEDHLPTDITANQLQSIIEMLEITE